MSYITGAQGLVGWTDDLPFLHLSTGGEKRYMVPSLMLRRSMGVLHTVTRWTGWALWVRKWILSLFPPCPGQVLVTLSPLTLQCRLWPTQPVTLSLELYHPASNELISRGSVQPTSAVFQRPRLKFCCGGRISQRWGGDRVCNTGTKISQVTRGWINGRVHIIYQFISAAI